MVLLNIINEFEGVAWYRGSVRASHTATPGWIHCIPKINYFALVVDDSVIYQ